MPRQSASERVNESPSEIMVGLIEASWLCKSIHLAVSLDIPDLLRNGPKPIEQLATETCTDPNALFRLMRALAGEGIFSADDCGLFSLTPLSETLITGVSGSLRDWALLMLGPINQGAWNEVMHSVRTGGSAFRQRFGLDLWEYGALNPEYSSLFGAAMAGFTRTYLENLLRSYSFAAFDCIVDVGGGDGSLLIQILYEYPAIAGVLYELPSVAERARQRIADAGLGGRCQVIGGDALVEVPKGGAAYVLSRVLHDWDDDCARTILTNCRKALPADGRVLVIERAMPDSIREIATKGNHVPSDVTMTDLNMMVMTSGRERTMTEYRDLFLTAGLELLNIVPTRTAMNVMEAGLKEAGA